jgi:hypothetical protein
MGLDESIFENEYPSVINHIHLLPKCEIKEFYVKSEGDDGKDCDSIDNACASLI